MSRKFRAWIAIVAFIGGLALPWLSASHVFFDDDAACGQTTYVAGAGTTDTQLTTATKAAAPLTHCPFCHWQRAVSGATTSSAQSAAPWLEFVESGFVSSVPHVRPPSVQHGPSRAPPSASLS